MSGKSEYQLFKASGADEATVERYIKGGCVYLAKAIEQIDSNRFVTIHLQRRYKVKRSCPHYAVLVNDGSGRILDIWGVWQPGEWHRYWKAYFGMKRCKISRLNTCWQPAQSDVHGEVDVSDVSEWAARLRDLDHEVSMRRRSKSSKLG